jgi:PKD repeat protein
MSDRFSVGAFTAVAVVTVVALAPVAGVVSITAGVQAQHSTYAVAQGTTCSVVDPVTNTSQNASSFYDYRNPFPAITGNPNASTYSSYGTQAYQETSASKLLFYEGSRSVSMVLVHGRLGDEDGGSTVSMSFSGLPSDGEWAVKDDVYPGREDNWTVGSTTSDVDWLWGPNRTDGGVFRGIDDLNDPIVVDPAFNEDAARWGEWNYSGSPEYRIDSWAVVDADGGELELDRDRRAFVHGGTCQVTPPNASVDGPTSIETGESVTFDAGDSTDDEALGGFEWDFDADGEVDEVTTDPGVSHAFDQAGNYTVTVTAFDRYGNGDTATMNVSVTVPASPPNASIAAPSEAVVDETVTLDATNSTDEGDIVEYRWDVDGDLAYEVNTTDATIEHTYESVGEVSPLVTVVDDDDTIDSDATTITVREPNQPPNAILDAPASAAAGEAVTLNASNSTDDHGIDHYEWDVDGDGSVEANTTAPLFEHTYNETGFVSPRVTVVDTNGSTNVATTNIRVEQGDTPPTAALSAPANATAGSEVTLDASASTDDGNIVEYRWDADGDGTVDETTSGPTYVHTYETPGEFEASVTVVDDDNQTATASETVQVASPGDPPNASIDSPAEVTVGDAVSLDASASSADNGIDHYEWDVDGDGTIETETAGPMLDQNYESAGEVDPSVTVVDSYGLTATASSSLSVAARSSGGSGGSSGGSGDDNSGGNAGNSDGGDSGGSSGNSGGGASSGTNTGGASGATDDGAGGQENSTETANGTDTSGEPQIGRVNVSLSTDELLVGETLVVQATVSNTGNATGTKGVEFEVEDEILTERLVPIAPNETRSLLFTHEFSTPGTKTIKVDYQDKHHVTVNPLEPDIRINRLQVDQQVNAGESFEVSALVVNTGDAEGQRTVELVLFEEVVDTETVSLDAGESTRVRFTREIQSAGTYDLAIGNKTTSVDVFENATNTTTAETTDDGPTGANVPGFDLSLAAMAFAVAAVVALRRHRS